MLGLTLNGKAQLLNGVRRVVTPPGASVPTSLTLIDFQSASAETWPVVQRHKRTLFGNVPVVFGFTGNPPTLVQARVVKASDGSVVIGWTTLTGQVNASATGAGKLSNVPVGRGYLLQIRDGTTAPNSGPLFSAGTQRWSVGVNFMVAGQSNLVGTFSGGGSAINENGYLHDNNIGAFYSDPGWTLSSDFTSPGPSSSIYSAQGNAAMFIRLVHSAVLQNTGVDMPIGLILMGYNATSIDYFLPAIYTYPQGNVWGPNIMADISRPAYAGDMEGCIWHQGEADENAGMQSYLNKVTAFNAGLLNYVAGFGRTPAEFMFATAILGNYAPVHNNGAPSIENVRIAEQLFVERSQAGTHVDPLGGALPAWPGVVKGWTTMDLWRGSGTFGVNPPDDPYHFSSYPAERRSLRRTAQTALWWLGASNNGPSGNPFSARGPVLTGAVTRSGLVATFAVSHEGGTTLTTLTAGAITGWYANAAADFSGAYIPVTVSVPDGSHVAVTFPSGTSFPAYVKHCGGRIGDTVIDSDGFTASCYPDIRNLLYDNVVYPSGATGADIEVLGLPLLASNGALVVT